MARTRVARFNIMITANANQVRQTFNKLSQQSKRWATSFTANLTSMSFAWNQISMAVGPVINKITEVASGLDELAKASSRVGVTAAFMQTLEVAANRAGIAVDTVRMMFRDFSVRIGRLREGDKGVTDAFAAIGLSAESLSQDTSQAFIQVRDGLNEINDLATRTAIAMEIFGRAGKDGIALLAANGQLELAAEHLDRVGGAFTDEQLARVEAFNDAWAALSERFQAIVQQVVIGVAPALQKVADILYDASEAVQALNRVAEQNPLLQFVLRGAFPAFEAFGTGQGTAASDALSQAQGRATQESVKEQKKQTSLLEQLNSKFSGDHFAFSMTGIST